MTLDYESQFHPLTCATVVEICKGVGRGFLFRSADPPPWLVNFIILTIHMPENLGSGPSWKCKKSPFDHPRSMPMKLPAASRPPIHAQFYLSVSVLLSCTVWLSLQIFENIFASTVSQKSSVSLFWSLETSNRNMESPI